MIDTLPSIRPTDQTTPESRPVSQILAAIDLATKIGAFHAAEPAARALIGRFPDALAPSLLLSRILIEQGHWRQAIEHLRWVLAIHPLDQGAWAGLAAALATGGQQREAHAALTRAALHDPLDSELLTPGVAQLPPEGLGVQYLRQGHDALACAELAETWQKQPERQDLLLYYVESLRRIGKLVEAQRLLLQLPDDLPATLPQLLLRAALDPSETAARLACARYDADGQYTRRFFAPLRPPWDLLPAPAVPLDATLEALLPFMAQAPAGRKSIDSYAVVHGNPPSLPVPAEVRAFMATAERMRTRLITPGETPPPLLAPADAERQVHVLLSHRMSLVQRFGQDTADLIDQRLRQLCESLGRRGLRAQLAYCDDQRSLQFGEQLQYAAVGGEAAAIAGLLRAIAGGLSEQGRELGTVLLIGGPECLPSFRMPNPLSDDDPEILSDLPYAGTDDTDFTPRLVVARLPDGGDAGFLIGQIDRMIARHHGPQRPFLSRLLPRPVETRTGWTLANGYAAEAWQEPARAILDALHPPADLNLCPPIERSTLDAAGFFGSALVYMNLHGAMGRNAWYGQPAEWGAATALPIALLPEQIQSCVEGGLLVSEACYGLELTRRRVADSIALRALQQGMAACVGSTVSAYGSYHTPLLGADLLAERLLVQLAAGQPVGAALALARGEFAQTMYRRQGYLDDVDRKTLLSFVTYGDPWASLPSVGSPPVPRHTPFPIRKAQRVPESTQIDERLVPRDVLRKVRATLRQVLPHANELRLAVMIRGDKRLALKGDSPLDMVFSTHEHIATADGANIVQAAHVTVSQHAIVKVALTH